MLFYFIKSWLWIWGMGLHLLTQAWLFKTCLHNLCPKSEGQLESQLWTSFPDSFKVTCTSLASDGETKSGQQVRCTLTPPGLWSFQPSWAWQQCAISAEKQVQRRPHHPFSLTKGWNVRFKEKWFFSTKGTISISLSEEK